MKKYSLLFYILVFTFNFQTMAKSNDPITEDKLLKKLQEAIPTGWTISANENKLTIERGDSVWIMFENKMNAPGYEYIGLTQEEIAKKEEEKIKKYGKKQKIQFIYSLEPKWTHEKIKKHQEEESLVWKSLGNLLKKYKLEHLVSKNAKGDVFFFENKASEDEKKRIKKFDKEKEELDKKAYQLNEQLPKYNTEQYSLVKEKEPDSQFEHIFPREVEQETFEIFKKIKENLIPLR